MQDAGASSLFLEIIDMVMFITNADKGSILLVNETSQTLRVTASRGFDTPLLDYFANCPPGRGACGTAFQNQERVIINDLNKDERFINTPYLEQLITKGVQAVQATPLKSRTGNILGILATYYKTPVYLDSRELQMVDLLASLSADIIERDQWFAERAMLVEKLRKAGRRKDQFLALLSHELRNPLASIANSALLLSYNAGSKEVKHAQAIINRQVAQLTRLVDDLLDVTRISQNKIQLKFQKIEVNELVSRIVDDHRIMFERAGLSLETQFADAPVWINADTIRIEQVLNNLLHNASKFSTQGGLTKIIIEQESVLKQAIIRVIDDGMGIDSNFVEHLFEPFVQADESLDRSQGGLGLGLALVKGLMELHHGSVSVSSPGLGLGTEFKLHLPLVLIETVKYSTTEKIKLGTNGISRAILIIDDNKDVADSLCMLLETLGHEVHVASNGFAGLAKALRFKPDCVLCDIGLPEINGYQVAQAFRAEPELSSICLVALSGYALPEEIEKAKGAGFDAHLAKPPNFNVLEDILANL